MNLYNILNETTYDLDFTDELYNDLATKLKNAKTQNGVNRTYDVTKYFPEEYNPKNKKVYIFTTLRPTGYATSTVRVPEKNAIKITLRTSARLENIFTKTELKRILDHEIIHVLDFLREKNYKDYGKKKQSKIDNIKTTEAVWDDDEERFISSGKKITVPDKWGENIAYRKEPFEFNVMINSVKKYKKSYPASWESIDTYEKLINVLSKACFYNPPTKHLTKDISFKEELVKRLYRESLLPPNYPYRKKEIGIKTEYTALQTMMRKYKRSNPNSWKMLTNFSKLSYVISKSDLSAEEKYRIRFAMKEKDIVKELREKRLLPPYYGLKEGKAD